ncbi:hypothetical protein ACET3X_005735 [Alternaria dauci]|uniref:non-specific serine/threonine protein kinase n=1 Tax=Alternaria dauci TaxID=48095 RepID=A0ABR3UG95_9PLEO
MSTNTDAAASDNLQKLERKDSGIATHEDEASAFCETMLGLADFQIKENPSLDQPDQLTLRNFQKIYDIPKNDANIVTKLVDHTALTVSEEDPADAPGLANFVRLLSNNKPETWRHSIDSAKRWLLMRESEKCAGDKFAVGKIVGGRWYIKEKITGVKGSCNQGILLVLDNTHGFIRVMKLLTSEAVDPGCSAREINILRRLSHPNIVSFFDAHTPSPVTERHATPYLVTEYCDKKTLFDAIRLCNQEENVIPEDFVWQVFEALVSAVKYLHHGPDDALPGTWDAISHRDIIPSNIFCTLGAPMSPYDYPVHIKLADFGCAITDSEMAAHPTPVEDLPLVSSYYVPPEGAQPTEATDMYQIGLIISLMYCKTNRPRPDVSDPGFLYQNRHPGFTEYTSELRTYLEMCLDVDDSQRPESRSFLSRIQSARRLLNRTGRLGTVEPDLLVFSR